MVIYNWMWVSYYRSIPFEIFFAMADSVKYVQFVFIAKWLQRKYLITMIGFWYIFQGIFSNIEDQSSFSVWSSILNYTGISDIEPDELNLAMNLQIQALKNLLTGALLMIAGIL